MTEHISIRSFYHMITCSICKKSVQSRLGGRGETYKIAREHARQRLAEGWKLYIGRGRRWYCPDHEPSRGHTMHQLGVDQA
ncbi:MAG: hypothetical protein K0S70_79 [Microbacterium sp.]|jgi:hypothetical protein|nr:hypothetical protein [Microbacterium sp.]